MGRPSANVSALEVSKRTVVLIYHLIRQLDLDTVQVKYDGGSDRTKSGTLHSCDHEDSGTNGRGNTNDLPSSRTVLAMAPPAGLESIVAEDVAWELPSLMRPSGRASIRPWLPGVTAAARWAYTREARAAQSGPVFWACLGAWREVPLRIGLGQPT